LFPNSGSISFALLKFIRNFVADLEVEKNRFWEWEAAILEGYKIYHLLRCEGQGTVVVDLEARSIVFRSGLPPKIANMITVADPASPSDAMSAATR
jgi:hypothetical protein